MGARRSSPSMILISLGSGSIVLTEASSITCKTHPWAMAYCELPPLLTHQLLCVSISFNVLHYETFEVIFHVSDEG
jgi:hypothetical protein